MRKLAQLIRHERDTAAGGIARASRRRTRAPCRHWRAGCVGGAEPPHQLPELRRSMASERVSIILVLLSHLNGTRYFPVSKSMFTSIDLGNLGVTVFFVISGFLISGLLFGEQSRTGTIDLAHFYMRRTLRIFPIYYVYVATIGVVAGLGWIELRTGDLVAALTYTMNYHPVRAWYLGHAWSLSLEEQFYLIWPITLVLLGRRRGLILACAFIAAAPFLRFWIWQFDFLPSFRSISDSSFLTTGDSIAIGCVLAWHETDYGINRCIANASRPGGLC